MYIDSSHVEQFHIEPLEEAHERLHTVVAQVLMIDGVEFPFLYKVEKIVRFGNKHTVIGKERLYGFDNFIDIVDMREYVVRRNDFRRTVFPDEFLGHINGEKSGNRLDALFACRLGDICRWLNAEHAACVGQKLQQNAVVASDVDDEVVFLQEIFLEVFRIRLEMLHERRGCGGEVCVISMKKLFLRHHVEKLHEIAGIAKIHIERVALLRVEVFPVREVVHGRMFAERKEPDEVPPFAYPALCFVYIAHAVLVSISCLGSYILYGYGSRVASRSGEK